MDSISLKYAQTDHFVQTPVSSSQRVGGRSLRARPRLPTLRPGFLPGGQKHRVPSLPGSPAASRHLSATLGLRPATRDLASLTRWQSASSTPTRAGRRILLDLSGGPLIRRSAFGAALNCLPDPCFLLSISTLLPVMAFDHAIVDIYPPCSGNLTLVRLRRLDVYYFP